MVAHPPRARYVLEGRVVPMGGRRALTDGAVYVDDGVIEHVESRESPLPDAKYRGATRVRTGGSIYPGFIELHNHLAYNAMPLWDVPTRYTNNGQWRGTEPYTRRITKPSQVLGQVDGVAQALVRVTEGRALLGGTTCSQGLTLANAGGVTKLYAGLLRNPEAPDDPRLPTAGTNIANPDTGGAAAYLQLLTGHSCYLQHLSEGTDDTALGWFRRLQIDTDRWAVNDRLCAIHCTALDADGFRLLADGGATMVWSPLSNYLLYGETADIAAAKASGLPISLGSDWAPSGSKNLLGELKVAWLASREHGDVFTPRELVEMITSNPARALKWDGLLGSIEPGKLADLVVVDGRDDDDPYEQLVKARESSITLVVIGGVPRVGQARLMGRFWDVGLDGKAWIDEVRVGRSARRLYLEHDADLLDGLALSTAVATLRDAMARLPELADEVDSAVVGSTGAGVVAGGVPVDGDTFRVVPDFEDEDRARLIEAMGFAAAAEPYAFWVTEPMTLDPLTVVDDRAHLHQLVRARNMPEFVRRDLPGLYGETRPVPDSASFLLDADVDPQLVATTTDLQTVLAASGRLGLDDRKAIVDQAIVLLTDVYVHLPLKRAMHAVDPVQRLRLLRHRLDETTPDAPEAMGPEIDFHAELTATFNSLRDLHTGYRLPAPYGSKVAWLPFLVEEAWDRGERAYLLTKWVGDAWPDPAMVGARITHWNGMPVEIALARNADRTAGSNPDARHARGLSSLTVRPLASGLPPDEAWVTVRWVDGRGVGHDHVQEWLVFEPGSPVGPDALLVEASAVGIDDHTDDIQQARKVLFAPRVAQAERDAATQVLATAIRDASGGVETFMPGVFRAMVVERSGSSGPSEAYGYVRIFSFNVPSAEPFVEEFARLLRLLPDRGLVIDVRGNGGGLIYAAEQLLQLLTPRAVEPEPAQFVSSVLNLRLCRNHRRSTAIPGLVLEPWVESLQQATRTGATFSKGVPITAPADANGRGQAYHGPVVLVTDALSYSATDMFAAGFQDHGIGPVVGVGGATGAGGANVWSHALLRRLMEPDNEDPGPSPFRPLPQGADLRVAVRRTTRVGANAGDVLEDLGVTPDVAYRMTRRDVLEGNRDLIETAIDQLAAERPHTLVLDRVVRHRDRGPSVVLRTRNVTRVDAEVDGRRLATRNVRRNRVTLELDGPAGAARALVVTGYETDELVAVLRTTIPP